MGWKGTLRSARSTYRAIQRDEQRRLRELQRREKEYARMQELEKAAYAVELHESLIAVLLSVHKEASPSVDWRKIADESEPPEPTPVTSHEDAAIAIHANYQPTLFDRILKRVDKKLLMLETRIDSERKKDEKLNHAARDKYQEELKDFMSRRDLAARILDGDPEAQLSALNDLNPFADIAELGSRVSVEIAGGSFITANIHVHGEDVIPKNNKTLLRSGKLSVKPFIKSRFNGLYQDYVCSCILRVANEVFAALPLEFAIVTAFDDMLNSTTGHIDETPIVSVAVARRTMEMLNMELIDPSDSLDNFIHRMKFSKTSGFSRIEPLSEDVLARLGAS